jgi:hypothetical protein
VDTSSWNGPELGLSDCVASLSSGTPVSADCKDRFSVGESRTALSGGRVGEDNSVFSSLTANSAKGLRLSHVKTSRFAVKDGNYPGLQNFWHSMSITPKHLYIGVRDTPGFVPSESVGIGQSLSGVYQINRETLEVDNFFGGILDPNSGLKKNVMRYAPVVADGSVFSSHWGYLDPTSRFLYKTNISDFSQSVKLDMGALLEQGYVAGRGIAGPMANQKSDSTCGTRLFMSSMSYGYFSPFNGLDQTRPIGLDDMQEHRGRVTCICSKTMETCPDWVNGYYYNGKAGGMPKDFDTVEEKHVNTLRADDLGTVRQMKCIDLATPISVGRLIPKSMVVELNISAPVGSILEGDLSLKPRKLEVLSSAADVCPMCVSVQYYAGHYNTPTIGMLLKTKSPRASYSLLSVRSITLDHGYAINAAQSQPGKSFTVAGVAESNFPISSFSETILLSTNVDLLATCETTAAFSSVVTLDADAYYPGSASKSIDFSGVTVKMKYSVGATLPSDAKKSVHSFGSNVWTPCAIDEQSDTLLCPFGNAHMFSFDRYQASLPALKIQRELEAARVSAIDANDKVAFQTVLSRHSEILAASSLAHSLMSEYDTHFKEDSIHAIDTKTGALKWGTKLEGADQWFLGLQSQSNFDVYWDSGAASAYGTDVWKDIDTNNVGVNDGIVYVSTKGGTLATLNLETGAVIATHRYAPGSPAGGAAPGNYGGMCVSKDGLVATLATTQTSPSAGTGPVSWISADGKQVPRNKGLVSVWDSISQIELWSVVIDQESAVGGISCIEDRVFAVCASGYGMCNYDARTGAVSQSLVDSGAPRGLAGSSGQLTYTTKSVMCDGPDCFAWNDGNSVSKYKMV